MSAGGNGGLRVAIVGATGAVGSQLLELIEERAFPHSELKLFSSEEHGGESIEAGEQTRPVDFLSDAAELSDSDLVFLAVQRPAAEAILGAAAGPIIVDLSAAALPPAGTPLVAPGFTAREEVRELSRFKLFHTPHPAALALAVVIKALGDVPFCAATVMLPASSAGHGSISRLVAQSADLLNGKLDLQADERQAAFNMGPFPGAPELEKALVAQVTRIIGIAPQLVLQSIQVPVLHGAAITMGLPNASGGDAWAAALRAAPGVLLVENEEAPSVVDAIGQEALLLTYSPGTAGSSLWCVFDNARRAALAALWIAECLVPGAAEKLN
jgi:aspartate-semialdehyde dehydrogenase